MHLSGRNTAYRISVYPDMQREMSRIFHIFIQISIARFCIIYPTLYGKWRGMSGSVASSFCSIVRFMVVGSPTRDRYRISFSSCIRLERFGKCGYEDYLIVLQNVTVNTGGDEPPHLGKRLILFAGAKIIGNQPVGDNVTIGVDAVVHKKTDSLQCACLS